MSVETKNAEITSASVEINTLRVSGRQLTLRTFRQLPAKSPIDPQSHEMRGTVWGWVNYFWKGAKSDMHAVWQSDGKLYRYPLSYPSKRTVEGLRKSFIRDRGDGTKIEFSRWLYQPTSNLKHAASELQELNEYDFRYHPQSNENDPWGHYDNIKYETLEEALEAFYETGAYKNYEAAFKSYVQALEAIEDKGQLYIAT